MEVPSHAVAKLIQEQDNLLDGGRKALPAVQRLTYHEVQFGKFAICRSTAVVLRRD
jgi:hypothetical protein